MITKDAKSVVEVMRKGLPAGRKIIPALPKGWVVHSSAKESDIADYVKRQSQGTAVWDAVIFLVDLLSQKTYVTLVTKGKNHEALLRDRGDYGKPEQFWYARIRISLKDKNANLAISTDRDLSDREQDTQKRMQMAKLAEIATQFAKYYKHVSGKEMPRLSIQAQEGKMDHKNVKFIYETDDVKVICSRMPKYEKKKGPLIDPYSLPDTPKKKERRESVERLVKKGKGKIKWDQESLSIVEA